jgi:hypothetical protein
MPGDDRLRSGQSGVVVVAAVDHSLVMPVDETLALG